MVCLFLICFCELDYTLSSKSFRNFCEFKRVVDIW